MERKPIAIIKLTVLSNGKDMNFQLDRNPRMADEDMVTILDAVVKEIKLKYGKKTD